MRNSGAQAVACAAAAFAFALTVPVRTRAKSPTAPARKTAYPDLGKIQKLYIDETGNGSPPSRQFARELKAALASTRCVELAAGPKGAPVILSDHPVDKFVSADDDPYVSCDTQGESVTCKGLGVSATADATGVYEGPETEKAYSWMFVDTRTDLIVDDWEMSDGADVSTEVRKTLEALGCSLPGSSLGAEHSSTGGKAPNAPSARPATAVHKPK